jgi:hypothetical protein
MSSRLIDVSNASQALLSAVVNRQLSYGNYTPYDNPTAISMVICPSGMINFNNFCSKCRLYNSMAVDKQNNFQCRISISVKSYLL